MRKIDKHRKQQKQKNQGSKIIYQLNDTVQVFRRGTTSNNKIESDKKRKIIQTYTFSKDQFNHVLQGLKGMKEFYKKANSNCLDCPFNYANEGVKFGLCYTMKFNQYVGFLSMLKGIIKEFKTFESLPTLTNDMKDNIIGLCKDRYVRFGTYGEPSLIPLDLIDGIVKVADNWTGYTHQWLKQPSLGLYFMASTHNEMQENEAREKGYRSFIATKEKINTFVNCPASKEAGFKSTCSKCGLCSGTQGKGTKSIFILEH
jgi:hypothetical protein